LQERNTSQQLLKELRALRDKATTAPAGCTALLLLLANP